MSHDWMLNGRVIHLNAPSDRAVAQRVAQHMQRRIAEDDWRPYATRDDALKAWIRLGGIRLQVLQALGLIDGSDAGSHG